MNFATFSQITFAFTVTPQLLLQGLVYALLLGFVGGCCRAFVRRGCRSRQGCESSELRRRMAADRRVGHVAGKPSAWGLPLVKRVRVSSSDSPRLAAFPPAIWLASRRGRLADRSIGSRHTTVMPELPDVTVYIEALATRIVGQPRAIVLKNPFLFEQRSRRYGRARVARSSACAGSASASRLHSKAICGSCCI